MLLRTANALHRFLERVADASGWLLIVLMAVTCVDVVFRKFGVVDFPYTKAQELEWHLHTAIFSFWLGFNYVVNAQDRKSTRLNSSHSQISYAVFCLKKKKKKKIIKKINRKKNNSHYNVPL